MKKTSETIVFFGSGPVAAASLAHLASIFSIEAVVTKARPAHHREAAPVEVLATDKNLPLLFANTKQELDNLLDTSRFTSRIGIIVDFGVIVSQKAIDSFELGIINSHFSLLPEWRGADPITFAILSGQAKTGVSLMLIEPTLDTGKLLTQKSLPITPDETTPTLTEKLVNLSNLLLEEYVPRYVQGEAKPRSQPHPDRATYSRKLTKEDGVIDWAKPAARLEREVRAYIEWPRSRTTLDGKEVIVLSARVVPGEAHQPGAVTVDDRRSKITIATSEESLQIDTLQPAGKKAMTAQAFLLGNLK